MRSTRTISVKAISTGSTARSRPFGASALISGLTLALGTNTVDVRASVGGTDTAIAFTSRLGRAGTGHVVRARGVRVAMVAVVAMSFAADGLGRTGAYSRTDSSARTGTGSGGVVVAVFVAVAVTVTAELCIRPDHLH